MHLESMISSLYGGRIAEQVIYGTEKVSTGASNDIERATEIARKMVTQWGLSEKMGPMLYAEEEGEVFLGRSAAKVKHMSDDTAKDIDEEIRNVIERNYKRAEDILRDNMDILHAMKDALMQYETIDAAQIDDLMARREVRQPKDYDDSKANDDQNGSSSSTTESKSDPDLRKPDDMPVN
jgi:cell division protease FtsH